ncbi:MAG: DUF1830 domain-containing protein [Waterburya sp.]
MAQILDPLPNDRNSSILCCYVNATSQIQIARITNVPNWYFERVVFPGQRLVFEADPSAIVEIHSGMMASAILSDTIPCQRLALQKNKQDQGREKSQITTKSQKTDNISASNPRQNKGVSASINVAV